MDMLLKTGAAAGALAAILLFLGMMLKMIRLLTRVVTEVTGAPGMPSLSERIAELGHKLDEHTETWHTGRSRVRERTNGGKPR